jgi:excisionase family DNA binding protein
MMYENDIRTVVRDDTAAPVPETKLEAPAPHRRNGEGEPESTGVGGVTTLSANDISQLEFLTVEECAQYLRLDRKTVYSMIRRGELPGARRCGRTYRIHRASVVSSFSAKPRPVHHGGKR